MTAPLVFVDADVLLQAVDDQGPARRDQARAWLAACWRRHCGRISTQVLHDYYWKATRRFTSAIARGDARADVRRYQHWQPWQIDQATLETAWAAEARYELSYWDALMVAAAQQQGCSLLLTEALPHDRQIDGVRIVNPFIVGPELLDTP